MTTEVKLTGDRVHLREFRLSDVDGCLRVVGDDRVTRFLSFDSRTREQAETMIEGTTDRAAQVPRPEYYLAVTPVGSDELVGFARLGLTGVKAAKLGYAVATDHQGKGYATDAARTMLDFAFSALDLHRVTAAVGPDNAASIVVVEKLGFTYEGTLRDHVFTNGSWRDSRLYSMLAGEWS